MVIEHSLDDDTQIAYGLLRWRQDDDEEYRKVFPDGPFTVEILGETLTRREVDWHMHRVYIIPKRLKSQLKRSDILLISRSSNGTVTIRKKGGALPPPIPIGDHPLVVKLREHQRDSDNPTQFEITVSEAFSFLGFKTRHIGGKDEPDVLLEDVGAIIDSKTTKEGVISERSINFDAMERYRDNHEATFLAVIAPGFSEGNIRSTAAKKGITLIETEALCKLVQNHSQYEYRLEAISSVLFESDKIVITAPDIPNSFTSEESLIELSSRILNVLKVSGVETISAFELRTHFQFQGLQYSADEINNALVFLSTAPFQILRSEGDQFKGGVNIQTLLKKMGLLVEVFSRLSRTQ